MSTCRHTRPSSSTTATAGGLRPRHAYAFGLIDQAARAAAHAPRLANGLARTRAVKRAAEMAAERDPPAFARQTFQRWFASRGGTRVRRGPRVVVFPDTFTNHFHPEIGVAAVEALESAGWQVVVPDGHLCCGRPLYDYGFLGFAERYLRRLLARLRPWYSIGVPIVGLEPSCAAVLKDELPKLLGDEGEALRAHTYHLAELYNAFELEPPPLEASALVWGHCHQKATGGVEADLALLRAMGIKAREAKGGCCGLAGSWGFEAGHYALSFEIAGHGLLPAVRASSADELVIANGFSCRMQLEHCAGRRALHIAQLLRRAA
jgi:Fe-S oxidoreductase